MRSDTKTPLDDDRALVWTLLDLLDTLAEIAANAPAEQPKTDTEMGTRKVSRPLPNAARPVDREPGTRFRQRRPSAEVKGSSSDRERQVSIPRRKAS